MRKKIEEPNLQLGLGGGGGGLVDDEICVGGQCPPVEWVDEVLAKVNSCCFLYAL